MDSRELLQRASLTTSLQPSPPWHSRNLRVTGAGNFLGTSCVTFEPLNPAKNGHLEQWCDAGKLLEKGVLSVKLALWAGAQDKVGVNIYLYFDPDDDSAQKVYQIQHPGDDTWQTLERDIPVLPRAVCRIRLMIVARVGAGVFRVGEVSLRYVPAQKEVSEKVLQRDHISKAYHDAVTQLVARHPSAADPAFREKLTRYLLGSNRKGIQAVVRFEKRLAAFGTTFVGSRFLDLGSGSGGSLVGALEAGAAYCEGWEINDEKLALSEINVGTCGVDAERVVVRNQTMEEPELLGENFQPFNIVFCEEVLEHVNDLDGAITTLSRCIKRKGGVGYVAMPNGFALQSVLADPHLGLFGIALLDRFEAQPLATALKNHTHYSEMMGTYHHYEDYVTQFATADLDLTPLETVDLSSKTLKTLRTNLDAVYARRESLRSDWGEKVDGMTLGLLEERLDAYLDKAEARWKMVVTEEAAASTRVAFARDYEQGHFAFLLRYAGPL